jgi:hypothetical protein
MSIGSISDVLSQLSQIEAQIQQLQSGSLLDSMLGVNSNSSTGTTSNTDSTGTTDSATFADALAQAQATNTDAVSDAATMGADTDFGSLASSDLGAASDAASNVLAASGGTSLSGADAALPTATSSLPSSSSALLTSGQQQFASTLATDTGLDPGVVNAWMLSEESGGAAQNRQAEGNNDWLNIGYTDSQTYGGADSVWSDPTTAANATAQWLQGQDSVAGYGTASSGIQSILQTVGQSPQAQIAALQQSGWSSSGYPNLTSLYTEVTGGAA